MPTKQPVRPATKSQAMVNGRQESFDAVELAIDQLAQAVARLEGAQRGRSVVFVDLAVGVNRINHNLGRKPTVATVTPTVADATWAWAMTDASATQIEITTIGVAQPNAAIEVW